MAAQPLRYDVCSRGKAESYFKGLEIVVDSFVHWKMIGPHFEIASCVGPEDPRKEVAAIWQHGILPQKMLKVVTEFAIKCGEKTAIALSPLAAYHRDREYDRESVKEDRVQAFLKQYPRCGSKEFNGGLVLYGDEIPKGLATVLAIAKPMEETNILFRQTQTHIRFGHHSCIHLASRRHEPIWAFRRAYRRHMAAFLPIHEEQGV
jgi:hypothetical protein